MFAVAIDWRFMWAPSVMVIMVIVFFVWLGITERADRKRDIKTEKYISDRNAFAPKYHEGSWKVWHKSTYRNRPPKKELFASNLSWESFSRLLEEYPDSQGTMVCRLIFINGYEIVELLSENSTHRYWIERD